LLQSAGGFVAATYLMGQARTEDERAFVEQLYEQAVEEGPDFINYRAKSAFEAAPRLASTATPSGGLTFGPNLAAGRRGEALMASSACATSAN
jgi:hypothetical protein